MNEDKNDATIERLRRAVKLGIKVSHIYTGTDLSPWRMRCIAGNLKHEYNRKLSDDEAKVINDFLDKVKQEL
jgi:hypothetical protein